MSNLEQLQSKDFFSDMRIKEVIGCTSFPYDIVTNLKFVLETTKNEHENPIELSLQMLGPDL